MDIDQAHRTAKLYDACWEVVDKGASGHPLSVETRVRFIANWGEPAKGRSDATMVAWASNFLLHNARPKV